MSNPELRISVTLRPKEIVIAGNPDIPIIDQLAGLALKGTPVTFDGESYFQGVSNRWRDEDTLELTFVASPAIAGAVVRLFEVVRGDK